MPWDTIVIAACSGGVFGAIASLIAPWANWGIEKKRDQLNSRRKLIQSIYSKINNGVTAEKFVRSVEYLQIRKFLPKSMRNEIEHVDDSGKTVLYVTVGGSQKPILSRLIEEIAVIEEKWGLR